MSSPALAEILDHLDKEGQTLGSLATSSDEALDSLTIADVQPLSRVKLLILKFELFFSYGRPIEENKKKQVMKTPVHEPVQDPYRKIRVEEYLPVYASECNKSADDIQKMIKDVVRFGSSGNIEIDTIGHKIKNLEKIKERFDNQNDILHKVTAYKLTLACIDKVRKNLSNPKNVIRIDNWVETSYHNTVCAQHNSLCHESCGLNFNGVQGTDFFRNCACMNLENKCGVCGCISDQHVHMHKKPVIDLKSVEELLHGFLRVTATSEQLILEELEQKERNVIFELCQEELRLSKISPKYKLSSFLHEEIKKIENQRNSTEDGAKLIEINETLRIFNEAARKVEQI